MDAFLKKVLTKLFHVPDAAESLFQYIHSLDLVSHLNRLFSEKHSTISRSLVILQLSPNLLCLRSNEMCGL